MAKPAAGGASTLRCLLVCCLLLVASCTASAVAAVPSGAGLALVHVNVVDVESGTIQPDRTVIIDAGRIERISPSRGTIFPPGVKIVDLRGKFLIPGLWDMHVHSSSDWITRNVYLPAYVAHGVLGVRDTKGDCFDPCDELESSSDQVRQWRQDIEAGRLTGPTIIAGSALINGPRRGRESTVHRPGTEADARALVHLLKGRNVDFIKTYSRLPPEAYHALADEARKLGIAVAGHVPFSVPLSAASDAGHKSVEHLWGVIEECSTREAELRPRLLSDLQQEPPTFAVLLQMADSFSPTKCARLYNKLKRNGTWLTPTLTIHDAILVPPGSNDPRFDFIHPKDREWWKAELKRILPLFPDNSRSLSVVQRKKMEIVRAANEAGVGILAGSDSGFPNVFPGSSLHRELELLVQAGLSPAAALRSATLNPARFFGTAGIIGTVSPAKTADLVILDGNPLTDIRNTARIDAVVLKGKFLSRAELDQMLDGVRKAAGAKRR